MPKYVTCDFCDALGPSSEPLPANQALPNGWLGIDIRIRGRALTTIERCMCPECVEERNIVIPDYRPITIGDAILDEIYDGIRDIVADNS